MHVTGFDLAQSIRELARLDLEGQLADLLHLHSLECRGLTSDSGQLFTANELIHVSVVAKALSVLFDLPDKECMVAVRSQLLPQPRREAALNLLDYFCNRGVITQEAEAAAEPLPRGLIQGKLSAAASE